MVADSFLSENFPDSQRLINKYVFKKMLQWWLPLMLVLAAVLWNVYYQKIETDKVRLRNTSRVAMRDSMLAIQQGMNWIVKDAHFLADMAGKLNVNQTDLTALFLSFMESRLGVYDHIRLLDLQGKERIRINDFDGKAWIVPNMQLQDKSAYYYFRQAQALQHGEVLLSSFDLNVEHGEVETPYKPMIRFIAKTFDKKGQPTGFVVLNYLGKDLITLIEKSLPTYTETQRHFWIVNEKGYWLQGPKPQLEWGFMFENKHNQTIARHFPEMWQTIQNSPQQGQVKLDDGLMTYRSYFVRSPFKPESGLIYSNADERWFLIDFIPESQLLQGRKALLNMLLFLFFLAGGLLSLILWLLLRNQGARYLIKQHERLFVDVMERVQTGIIVLDNQGKPFYMNKMAASTVGDILCGQFHPNALSEYRIYKEGCDHLYDREELPVIKALHGETASANDLEIRQGGKKISIQITATPIIDGNGMITHAVVSFQDISLLKQQERFCEAEVFHRALLNSAIDAIITIDETGAIVRLNPAAETMFGYSREDLLGSNIKLLIPEPFKSLHDDFIDNYLRSGVSKIIGIGREVEVQSQDGRLIPCDLAITEVKIADKLYFTGILRDISERKRIENMEKEFISIASHELRTPLTSINGALELLINDVIGEIDSEAKELLEVAHINTDQLIQMVNHILEISKLESGTINFDLRRESILNLIEAAVVANELDAEKNLPCIEIVKGVVDADVYVDKNRFIQILSILLLNAVKFSPANGHVNISSQQHGNNVRVTVADHGTEVEDVFKDRLFKKFSRTTRYSPVNHGMGLALCLAKGLIEGMGGNIGYCSVSGQGNMFYVELPVCPNEAIAAAKVTNPNNNSDYDDVFK